MVIRKYKVGIRSAGIANLLDGLPKGMRTLVIESALTVYAKSNDGKALLKHFSLLDNEENIKEATETVSAKTKAKEELPKIQVQKKKNKKNKGFVKKFKGGFR